MPGNFDDKTTLDKNKKELDKIWYGKNSKRKSALFKFKKHKIIFVKILIVSLFVFSIFIVYKIITKPIQYTDKETQANIEKLEKNIEEAGNFKTKFNNAINILKNHPYFYKKVVNNIDKIQIKKVCPYMCVMKYLELNSVWDLIIAPKSQGETPLIINPESIDVYDNDYRFASALMHEADHVEYLKSGRLRKLFLIFKCNPVTNFRISVDSTVPTIIHRISPMEICAQKEQIKFHKETNTKSGYEIKNGLFYNFALSVLSVFKFFFSFIYVSF